MKSRRCIGVVAVVLALGLGACSSGSGHTGDPAAAQSQWLAVARGKVGIEGGMVQISARTNGVVESLAVKQGDAVQAGQVLARLDPRAAGIEVATAKAGVAQAQAQLDQLQVSLQQARRRAPRIVSAAQAGAATGEAADQAKAAVASLTAKRAAARAALDVARQQLAAAQLALDGTRLRAPVAGTVVARRISIGQYVAAESGRPLFELLPDRPRVVHTQLDANAAYAIHRGMHAEVMRDSDAGPAYPATVLWVGQVLQPASLTRDPLQRAIANDVDCLLELDSVAGGKGKPPPLRIGQRVLVKFPRD